MDNLWEKFDNAIKSLIHGVRHWPVEKKDFKDASKIWYHRIDEAFLIVSQVMDISFIDVCRRYWVDYDQLLKLKDNKNEKYLIVFKRGNAQYGVEEEHEI